MEIVLGVDRMCISLLEGTSGVNIQIVNSIFHKNNANWGGGLCIYLLGGGGVQVRLGEQGSGLEKFKKVTFNNNTSCYRFGGGTSINVMFISNATEAEGILQFINCSWFNNHGRYSPAVDLSPTRFQQSNQGYLPIPLFKDITVIGNHVSKTKTSWTIPCYPRSVYNNSLFCTFSRLGS
jgi:hypothetical protein